MICWPEMSQTRQWRHFSLYDDFFNDSDFKIYFHNGTILSTITNSRYIIYYAVREWYTLFMVPALFLVFKPELQISDIFLCKCSFNEISFITTLRKLFHICILFKWFKICIIFDKIIILFARVWLKFCEGSNVARVRFHWN